MPVLKIAIITIFPDMFSSLKTGGVIKRAIDKGIVELHLLNLRDFSDNAHGYVDDRPYGGGPGMVLKYQPLKKAILHAKTLLGDNCKTIYLSPQGIRLEQKMLSQHVNTGAKPLLFIAGRYEGIDERIITHFVDEEWSIGDVVLSGGELAAMVAVDALTRLMPSALNCPASIEQDSFSDGLLDTPHYTRPDEIDGLRVPEVLLNGNHKTIERWRLKQKLGNTRLKRPDLLKDKPLSQDEQKLLAEFMNERSD